MAEMVFVVSTCGFGSFGDDCPMETLRSELESAWPWTSVAINRWDDAEFLPEEQEALVLGGGGWLYDFLYGQTDNLQHFLRYPRAMQWFDHPTYALGVGVQGRLTREALAPWVDTLNGMDLRTVRDPESAAILRDAGVSEPVIESADLSYLIPLAERPRPEREPRRPVIGVAVSQPFGGVLHDEYPGFGDRVRESLERLTDDFDVRFYSFDRRNEGAIAGSYSDSPSCTAYDPARPDAVSRFIGDLGEADLLLTSRFHGLILAARMGVPVVPLGVPGEKVERESRALGSEFLSYGATAESIGEAVRTVWAERTRSRTRIEQGVRRQERLARESFRALGKPENPPVGCRA